MQTTKKKIQKKINKLKSFSLLFCVVGSSCNNNNCNNKLQQLLLVRHAISFACKIYYFNFVATCWNKIYYCQKLKCNRKYYVNLLTADMMMMITLKISNFIVGDIAIFSPQTTWWQQLLVEHMTEYVWQITRISRKL